MSDYLAFSEVCQTVVQWLNGDVRDDPNWPAAKWPLLKQISVVHGVAPLLHARLAGVPWLPDDMRSWFLAQYRANRARVARMQAEARLILAGFEAAGIPIAPLKGLVLQTQYYADPALRPMSDLDFLISPPHYTAGLGLLTQLGYQVQRSHWKNIELIKPDNVQVIDPFCEHPDNPRWVELHLACKEMFGGPNLDLTECVWAQGREAQLLGETAVLMSPETLWLHLAAHTSADLWRGKARLIQLIDLWTLQPHVPNLSAALESVEARFVGLGLSLLQRTFPRTLSESQETSLRRRVSGPFWRWAKSFDLVNSSRLNPDPKLPYLLKVLRFNEGRPREILQALRYIFWPDRAALMSPTSIQGAVSGKSWYLYHWFFHVRRLLLRLLLLKEEA